MLPLREFKGDQMVIAKRKSAEIACIILESHWNSKENNWEYLAYSAEKPELVFLFKEGSIRHLSNEDIN